MAGDSEATRRRLLDAATEEFAAYGIAGARVDRIAEAAKSNKAQIYHYFTNKDGLFDAVFNAMCVETVQEVPIDTSDLPEYAGRLFDSYERRPYVQRLATWYRLERGDSAKPLDTGPRRQQGEGREDRRRPEGRPVAEAVFRGRPARPRPAPVVAMDGAGAGVRGARGPAFTYSSAQGGHRSRRTTDRRLIRARAYARPTG